MQIRELDPYKFTNTNYLEDTPLDEETKKELLEIQNNIISPKKFHLNSLDSNLKEFFYRDKHYYLRIENMLKNSNSELEMLMKFLRILRDIYIMQDGYRKVLKNGDINFFNNINILDKYKHFYPFKFNIRLYHIFKDFVNNSMELEDYQTYKTIYFFGNSYLDFEISYIKKTLEYIKNILLEDYQENKGILDMIKNLQVKKKSGLKFNELIFLMLSSKNEYSDFFYIIDFINKIDLLKTKKEKLEFIKKINGIIEILKCYSFFNLKKMLSSIKRDIPEELQEPFIKYINKLPHIPIINFRKSCYPSSKKFYLELDFNMPKELVMKQIETLYKEYESGNIQTFEEYALDKKIPKKEQLETLNKQIDFKSLTSCNNPLYVVLTDFIYIIDMKLINMTDTHIYSRINDNRCHRYNNNKGFEMSYKKKYKKLVLDFYIQDKYNIYLS